MDLEAWLVERAAPHPGPFGMCVFSKQPFFHPGHTHTAPLPPRDLETPSPHRLAEKASLQCVRTSVTLCMCWANSVTCCFSNFDFRTIYLVCDYEH